MFQILVVQVNITIILLDSEYANNAICIPTCSVHFRLMVNRTRKIPSYSAEQLRLVIHHTTNPAHMNKPTADSPLYAIQFLNSTKYLRYPVGPNGLFRHNYTAKM